MMITFHSHCIVQTNEMIVCDHFDRGEVDFDHDDII